MFVQELEFIEITSQSVLHQVREIQVAQKVLNWRHKVNQLLNIVNPFWDDSESHHSVWQAIL
jgi:hypothetical protein